MEEVRHRIEEELGQVLDRLRQLGRAVLIEEFRGAPGGNRSPADLMDKVQLQEDREVNMASRSLLMERARRLTEALVRLREGTYGICEECGEAIAPARLKAMAEVTTCVSCQVRRERMVRQLAADPGPAPKGGAR